LTGFASGHLGIYRYLTKTFRRWGLDLPRNISAFSDISRRHLVYLWTMLVAGRLGRQVDWICLGTSRHFPIYPEHISPLVYRLVDGRPGRQVDWNCLGTSRHFPISPEDISPLGTGFASGHLGIFRYLPKTFRRWSTGGLC